MRCQRLAAAKSSFEFMKQFFVFATLGSARRGSACSPKTCLADDLATKLYAQASSGSRKCRVEGKT
jgi:hypothetical protein